MSKKIIYTLAIGLMTALTGMAQNQKPNIIVVLTDDQGWADVGFNGATDIPTPNLDKLASQGVIFDNGYVSTSVL
ncbi:sulfatase-like hydrolase/transferase [Zobellia russellii]|uniref:sulfatase-like hydrolase/transferase n=1 Tax=Zobellia russellii TaxID=248907 RepID=UPI001FE40ADF|nr:sulfatase-like hydrolase/transferase [Zobellia russellii]